MTDFDQQAMDDDAAFNSDVKRLLRAATAALKTMPRDSHAFENLRDAIEQVEPWFDSDDPRDMGWVDARGRP